MRMFIQTEITPNPATLKFLPGCDVIGEGTANFTDADQAARSPLAQRLFELDGDATARHRKHAPLLCPRGGGGSAGRVVTCRPALLGDLACPMISSKKTVPAGVPTARSKVAQ